MISQKKKEGKTSGEAMFVFTGINTWKQHYRRSTVVIIIIGSRNNDLSGDIRYARYNLWDDIAYSNFRVERINKSARVIPTRKSASKRKGMARVRKREREGGRRTDSMRFVRLPIDAFHAVSRNVANFNQANGNWRLSSFVYYLNQYYRELQINYYQCYFLAHVAHIRLTFDD